MVKVLCIYHADCADGLGAAWAVHRALGDEVEFVAAKYGNDSGTIPDGLRVTHVFDSENNRTVETSGRDVLIVDFSYPLPILCAMAAEARSVLVLDHHKTAREDLASLPAPSTWKDWLRDLRCELCETASLEEMHPDGGDLLHTNLAAIFDMERSGAGLTWDYLHGQHGVHGTQPAPRPRIIDLVEDRDLWKFAHGDETRAFHAWLTSYNMSDLKVMFSLLDAMV